MGKTHLEILRRQLARVYWLGGSPCAGKSLIADSLVQTYGFQVYRCDDAFFRHEKIVTLEHQPIFYRLVHLRLTGSMDACSIGRLSLSERTTVLALFDTLDHMNQVLEALF